MGMKGIGIRLYLNSEVLAKLVSAIPERFRHFVRLGSVHPAGELHQVDIRILEYYDASEAKAGGEIKPTKAVTVTREMVGELFDLLGIFPRAEEGRYVKEVAVSAIRERLELIVKKAADREFVPQWIEEINYHLDSLVK